jgi:hypothetical protein
MEKISRTFCPSYSGEEFLAVKGSGYFSSSVIIVTINLYFIV